MKKLCLIILSLFVFIACVIPNNDIKAYTEEQIIEQELQEAIISGDGSQENPYVIDPNLAPVFSEYLKNAGTPLIEALASGTDPLISPRTLEGLLSGTSYSNQTNGGRWRYTSGGMNVNYNGSVTMKKVNYIGYNDVLNLKAGFSNVTAKGIFEDIWDEIYNDPFSTAVERLIEEGVRNTWAASMVKWLGYGSTAFSYAVIAVEISLFFQQKPYNDAASQNKGVIRAEYNTAYQGAWYATSLTEVWSNYPTARVPSTTYGNGTYSIGYPSV